MVWSFWPLSEEQLFAKASVIMEANDPLLWDRALSDYLLPLQQKYPQGKYAEKTQEYIDRIEMAKAEKRIEFNRRLGREPASEAESLYIQAHRYEEFGDRVTAADKYNSLVHLLKEKVDARPYVNLARRQIASFESSGGKATDRLKLVDEALEKADKLFVDGKSLEARKVWQSLVTLYETNEEMRPQVERARSRLKDSAGSESRGPSLLDRLKKPG